MATLRSAKQTTGQPKRSRFLTSLATSAIMLASLLGVSAAYPQATAQAVTCVSADRSVTGVTNLAATPPEYATIGAAVTAASPGEQICIGAGTWPEQVTISKELTLTGAGEAVTIISSPASLVAVCGTDLDPAAVAIVDVCSSNVTISDLTVDGDAAGDGAQTGMPSSGSTDFFGLVVHGGATATISAVTVTNVHTADPTHWGNQSGDAIWVAPASTLNATDIHVLRYQKSGVVAYGSETELAYITLTDSLIEGDLLAGMNASIAMNGITIVRTNASLHGVTSRGNQCTHVSCSSSPEDSNAGGILIYDWDVTDPVMNVSIIDSIFTENDIGVYTDVTNPTSSIAVDSNDISGNRWFGVQLDEGHANFAYNDITNNGIAGVVAIAGAYGVSDNDSTFLQNVITGNGGISPASGAIRLADHSGSDLSKSANLTFTNNAIFSNAGTTVANLSAAGVITGTGTWWGIAGQPLDVSGTFTADLATLSDALATDASDAAYGFIVSSVAIDSSVDLPPLTIASSDRAAMPTPISLDFGAISGGGTVTVVPSAQAAEGSISFGANPSVIDIDFTGTFTGSVEVCIGYDPAQYYAGSSILLFHFIGGTWVDVTSSVDESTRRVCGLVSSFSPFAAGEELAVYAITYDANDGTLAGGEDPSYTYGDAAITAPSDPTRTGYDFAGWFRDDITFATSAFPLTPTGDTTVYAKWDIDVYTITYDANDGTLAGGEDPSYTYGDAAITAPSDPTRTGYDFAGWFRDDITFATSAFPLTPTGDTTVYAKWDLIEDDADLIAPTTTAPVVSISLGSQVGSSAPLHIEWTGADNVGGSGIDSYDVEVSMNGGRTWLTVASSVVATSVDVDTPAIGTLIYRVRARDVAENIGEWVLGQKFSPQLLREGDRAARYRGRWARLKGAEYTNNLATTARLTGDSLTLTFTGQSLGIIASTGPTAGTIRISVDGTVVATVDLSAATASVRQVVWAERWGTAKRRSILVVATRATRTTHVEIDGFVTLQ